MAYVAVNNPPPHTFLPPTTNDSTTTTTNPSDFLEFEFLRLDDTIATIPADQLFSDGKLLPLSLSKPPNPSPDPPTVPKSDITVAPSTDPYIFSPRAPTCSGRWRHLLRLRKKTPNPNSNPRSLKQTLDAVPLLSDPPEPLPLSPRLSLDDHHLLPRVRLVRPIPQEMPPRTGRSPLRRSTEAAPPPRSVSVDSPRMNSSGKIVYQGLERSSSHPGSVKPAGSRPRARGMERSYSANVRVTPVLNVPVCSLRGSAAVFSQLFASPAGSANKKDGPQTSTASGSGISRTGSRAKTDRI